MQNFEFKIEGMTCGHCVRGVKDVLEEADGVSTVEVEIGRAQVSAEDVVSRQTLVDLIEEEEYKVVG